MNRGHSSTPLTFRSDRAEREESVQRRRIRRELHHLAHVLMESRWRSVAHEDLKYLPQLVGQVERPALRRRCSARLDLHGEILSVAGSEVLVCQLIAEIDPLFIRDRLPSSDPVVRFLAHGVAELRLIRF